MTSALNYLRNRPGATATAWWALSFTISVIVGVTLSLVTPQLDTLTQRLIGVLILAAIATVIVSWKHPRLLRNGTCPPLLLVIPIIIALLPFIAGLRIEAATPVAIIVIGYLATAVYEELWFRGLVLDSLRNWSPMRAALFSSALFGLAHLSNITFGANPAITAAQVVGAACFGVGLAALRLRGLALWPLILLHAITDIGLALGELTSAWRWAIMIGGDTALLIFGLIVLRAATRQNPAAPTRSTDTPRGVTHGAPKPSKR